MANEIVHPLLPLEDLKKIIHGLRMSTLSFVEPEALMEINSMIKALPSSEEIDGMADSSERVENLQQAVGGIMRLIELYGKRDREYKIRYKQKTNLPPRYKILDWKSSGGKREMKYSNKKNITAQDKIILDMIKLSEALDNIGYGDLSGKVLKTANDLNSNKFSLKEFYEISKDVLSVIDNGRFVKTAYTELDLNLGDVKDGLNEVIMWFSNVLNTLAQKTQGLGDKQSAQPYVEGLKNIYKKIHNLAINVWNNVDTVLPEIYQVEEGLQSLVPQSIQIRGETHEIDFIDDPENPGWQRATVTVNGKQYEVQEDEQGKRSIKPLIQLTKDIKVGDEMKWNNKDVVVSGFAADGNIQLIYKETGQIATSVRPETIAKLKAQKQNISVPQQREPVSEELYNGINKGDEIVARGKKYRANRFSDGRIYLINEQGEEDTYATPEDFFKYKVV